MEEKRTVGQKVKGHFKKHKRKYITVGTLGVGIGVGYYLGKKYGIHTCSNSVTTDVTPNSIAIAGGTVNNNITVNNNVIQQLARQGEAGNIIYCPQLDRLFNSQGEAERECNLARGTVSKIVNGKKECTSNGLTFIKKGSFNNDSPNIES